MKIAMILRRHSPERLSPIMPEVAALLSEWGVEVTCIFPEETLTDLENVRVEHDLYVVKSKSPLALSYIGALHAAGARLVNSYEATLKMRDKIVATRVLQLAGIPTPETYTACDPRQLAALLREGPLVVKPYQGSGGEGIEVLENIDDLSRISADSAPLFAQRYYRPDGMDRKVYCIGGQLFGVERVFPARTYEEKLGRPFTLEPELRRIAKACGDALGVDLFGVDIILSQNRPLVVDASSFPGFKGVPDAALRLADYIYACSRGVTAEKAMASS